MAKRKKHKYSRAALKAEQKIKVPASGDLEGGQVVRLVQQPKIYGDHPSSGLTPKKLASIMEDAEQGDITAQHELFADMEEKDGHIQAEMGKRKNALLKLDWNIKPPKNATPAEVKLTEELSEWFDNLDGQDALILDLADAIGHGFSAIELKWQLSNGVWLPNQFIHRPQSWFKFTEQDEIRLKSDKPEGEELWPMGWLIHKHRARSGQTARMGLHRTLAWPYIYKSYSVKDLAELLEIYGIPVRLGKYPPGSSDKEKLDLINALISIGHNAAGIIPDGMEIAFEAAAAGNVDPFDTMIKWCEKTCSKVILGGTLTTEADGKTSTNALGKVHNEVRHDILGSDARQIESAFNKLIEMLVFLNKGKIDNLRLPGFYFDIKNPEEVEKTADLIVKMVGVGMRIPESWAHEKLDIPLPAEDEPVLQMAQPVTQPEQTALTYRQVALSKQGQPVDFQTALSEAELPADNLNDQIAPIVATISNQLSQCASHEEAMEALNTLYPKLDSDLFHEVMARALFVSDVWGRLNERR